MRWRRTPSRTMTRSRQCLAPTPGRGDARPRGQWEVGNGVPSGDHSVFRHTGNPRRRPRTRALLHGEVVRREGAGVRHWLSAKDLATDVERHRIHDQPAATWWLRAVAR